MKSQIRQDKNLTIEYSDLLRSYIVQKNTTPDRTLTILYAPGLKAHCQKYGIPCKTWRNLADYLTSATCYLPKELMGYN